MKNRKRYSAQEKVMLIKRHLVNKEEISQICDEQGLHPNVYYKWQREFFERGAKAFEKDEKRSFRESEQKLAKLEAKLQKKDSVLSELMEAHVDLKKSLGEL